MKEKNEIKVKWSGEFINYKLLEIDS